MPKIDKKKNNLKVDKNYQELLKEVKSLFSKGLFKAYKVVDNIKVQTYWQIGERIVREELSYKNRADYGKYLVEKLAVDLGVKKRRLYEIVKFYRCYESVRSLTAQLSWTHYVALIDIDDDKERIFYENKSIQDSWSVRELKKQIKNGLYEKLSPKERKAVFYTKLPTVKPEKIFQNTYDFQFIKFSSSKNEKILENKLVENIEQFLHSLGSDFAFLGRQVPIKIEKETHFIDLVLFHKAIPCNVLVDLKMEKLDSRDVGQMNKYVNYYREHKQYAYEKDTIGLIICKRAGKEEVRYALGGLEKKIFIAEYKVKLPSEEKIKRIVRAL